MILDGVEIDVDRKRYVPRNPHKFAVNHYICMTCGISEQAIVEFPQLAECTPFTTTRVREPELIEDV